MEKIRFLSLNLNLLPRGVNPVGHGHKTARLAEFCKLHLEQYDIIAFQEVFSTPYLPTSLGPFSWKNGCRQRQLIYEAARRGFKYAVRGPQPSWFDMVRKKRFTDCGLVIVSKYPIVKAGGITFRNRGCNLDANAAKGAIFAKIKLGDSHLIIFNTHLQASHSESSSYQEIRRAQLVELRNFIHEVCHQHGTNAHVIITGDFNIDAIASTPATTTAATSATASLTSSSDAIVGATLKRWTFTSGESVEYKELIEILDPFRGSLRDLLKECHGGNHPPTRPPRFEFPRKVDLIFKHKYPQRLDYVFYISAPVPTGLSLWGEGSGDPPIHTGLVPLVVRGRPYVSLSDHYGIRVWFEFQRKDDFDFDLPPLVGSLRQPARPAPDGSDRSDSGGPNGTGHHGVAMATGLYDDSVLLHEVEDGNGRGVGASRRTRRSLSRRLWPVAMATLMALALLVSTQRANVGVVFAGILLVKYYQWMFGTPQRTNRQQETSDKDEQGANRLADWSAISPNGTRPRKDTAAAVFGEYDAVTGEGPIHRNPLAPEQLIGWEVDGEERPSTSLKIRPPQRLEEGEEKLSLSDSDAIDNDRNTIDSAFSEPRTIAECRTLYDCFALGVRCHGYRRCLGYRPSATTLGHGPALFGESLSVPVSSSPGGPLSTGDTSSTTQPSHVTADRTVGDGGYVWMTYDDVNNYTAAFAVGLRRLLMSSGVAVDACVAANMPPRVGIIGANRPEWVIAELACVAAAPPLVAVPLHDVAMSTPVGPGSETNSLVAYAVQHADVAVVVCARPHTFEILRELQRTRLQGTESPLKCVVQMDPIEYEEFSAAEAASVRLLPFQYVLKDGLRYMSPVSIAQRPRPDDVAVILYDINTLGKVKGIVHTHRSLVAAARAMVFQGKEEKIEISPDDCYFSSFNLSHVIQQATMPLLFAHGAGLALYAAPSNAALTNVVDFFAEIGRLRPTIVTAVPSVFIRLYRIYRLIISTWSKAERWAFARAYSAKRSALKRPNTADADSMALPWRRILRRLVDQLLFRPFAARLGGRLRLIMLNTDGLLPVIYKEFLQICLCCQVTQVYLKTETAIVTASLSDYDQAGYPLPSNEVKLVDLVDSGFTSACKPERGEIYIRGANVFKEYYKDPELTAAKLRPGGWLATGEIGQWNENGSLTILGHKNGLLEPVPGKIVFDKYLEFVFSESNFVQQVFITCRRHRPLVAIVVPDREMLFGWARRRGVDGHDFDIRSLCGDVRAWGAVLADLHAIGRRAGLEEYELPRAVWLSADYWTPDNGCMTPSLYLRRSTLAMRYAGVIDEMYDAIDKADCLCRKATAQRDALVESNGEESIARPPTPTTAPAELFVRPAETLRSTLGDIRALLPARKGQSATIGLARSQRKHGLAEDVAATSMLRTPINVAAG